MSKDESIIISPSILAANFANLGAEVDRVLASGADWVHFDVMDNHYVPNLTLGPMVCKALRNHGVTAPIDVHLMVQPVDALIESFAKAGASHISFHPDATPHVDRSLQLIKAHGLTAGLALNPAAPLNVLDYVLGQLDLVLLMSVNPGFGGQAFIPETLQKIHDLSLRIKSLGKDIQIQVDGGIGLNNIDAVVKAGANNVVAGTAIFGQRNYEEVISGMRSKVAAALI